MKTEKIKLRDYSQVTKTMSLSFFTIIIHLQLLPHILLQSSRHCCLEKELS